MCRGDDLTLFFEDYETNPEIARETDALCESCPVKRECLTMAIDNSGTGAHGGVYLVLGHFSKARNKHKTIEEQEHYKDLITDIKDELNEL